MLYVTVTQVLPNVRLMSDVLVKFKGKLTGLPSIKIQMMTMKFKYRIKKQK